MRGCLFWEGKTHKWISVLPMCMTFTKVLASNMPKIGEDDPI